VDNEGRTNDLLFDEGGLMAAIVATYDLRGLVRWIYGARQGRAQTEATDEATDEA
jgi:hypothetical protein